MEGAGIGLEEVTCETCNYTDVWIAGNLTLLRLVFDTAALRLRRSATVLKASRSNVNGT